MKDMKEVRILITDVPKYWDDLDWSDIEDDLYSVMCKYLPKHDFNIVFWDVG